MLKKLLLCFLSTSFLGSHGMQLSPTEIIGKIFMLNIERHPYLEKMLLHNICNAQQPFNCKRSLLQYFRQYQDNTFIPFGLNSMSMPLKTIQYFWPKYVRHRANLVAFLISGACYHIVRETYKFFNCQDFQPSAPYVGDRSEEFLPNIFSIYGLTLFQQHEIPFYSQWLQQYKKMIAVWCRDDLHSDKLPVILVALQPIFSASIIFFEPPAQVSLINDFPLQYLLLPICSEKRSTILSSLDCLQSINKSLNYFFDKGFVKTYNSLKEVLNNIK